MAEVARVLKPAGSLWLNLGDSYSRHDKYGAPPKGLLCAPERMLLALADDGWLVRNKVIWAKPNPMPASVADRLNTTYEVVYFPGPQRPLLLRPRCHPGTASLEGGTVGITADGQGAGLGGAAGRVTRRTAPGPGSRPAGAPAGQEPRRCLEIPPRLPGGALRHLPRHLVYRPLLATCPEAVCTSCGKPWRREWRQFGGSGPPKQAPPDDPNVLPLHELLAHPADRRPDPLWLRAPTRPGVVLDPFFGSGTVGVVAEALGRDWIGIELNPDYADLARTRIEAAREGVMNNKERSAA